MQFIIIGSEHSGMSLTSAILNCSSKVKLNNQPLEELNCFCPRDEDITEIFFFPITQKLFQKTGIQLIDQLIAFSNTNIAKFLWIVRNPLDSSCSSILKHKTLPEQAIKHWMQANLTLWYFLHSIPNKRWLRIRFEDIIMSKKKIKNMFNFCDVEFHNQYLDYGDFDQPHNNDPVFQNGIIDNEHVDQYNKTKLKEIWKTYSNCPIVIDMDY